MYNSDWFSKWSVYSPNKVAVRDASNGESLTYAQLNDKGEQLALFLHHTKGIKKGDRIAVVSDFGMPYFLLFAAAQKLGFVLVPLNQRLAAREVNFLLSNSEPSLFVYEEKYHELATDANADLNIETCTNEDIESWSNSSVTGRLPGEGPEMDDPIFILYTSGTTGFPKGALYTHKMMMWNSLNTALRLNITAFDHTLMVMPPFHTGGWNVLTTPFLHFGASVTVLPKFEPDEVLQLLEDESSTLFMAVPTMVRMLADSPEFEKVTLKDLRYFIVGGEALPIPMIEKWAEKGVMIRQGYGLTEVGTNVTSLPAEDAIRKRGSIGFPNFYIESKLVQEDGAEAGVNEIGEFWLRGPVVTPGYWKNPEATAKSIEDGWFKTGDLLKKDEEGYLYVVDRIKNMFISGGENVYPAEIEKYLVTHPDVKEVAVIGVPNETWGEVGKAIIVSEREVTAEELKEFCKKGLAKFKVPKHFAFMDKLPQTDSGKIDKKGLAEV